MITSDSVEDPAMAVDSWTVAARQKCAKAVRMTHDAVSGALYALPIRGFVKMRAAAKLAKLSVPVRPA